MFPFCTEEVDADELGECDAHRAIMLQDLSPGGQYALFVNTNGVYTPLTASASVHSMLTEDALGTDKDWKHPSGGYKDALGNQAWVIVTPLVGGGYTPAVASGVTPISIGNGLYKIKPEELQNVADFIVLFKSSWAKALLPYHPEYCFLQFCDNNATSNTYDQAMLDTYTFSSACSAGFFKPLASSQNSNPIPCTSGTTNFDPFFAAGGQGSGQYSSMLSDMDDYQGTGYSIWQNAIYEAFCNGSGSIADCLDNYRNASAADKECMADLIWVNYREMYLALKQQKINAVQQANTSCSNAQIGVNANWINNVAVWGNATTLPDADGDGFPENGSNLTQAEFEAYMDAQVAAQCQSACEDYADDWLVTLQGCEQIAALSPTQQTNLRNDLIALCTSGCNSDHPMGASTSLTGQTIDDILATYITNYEDEFCTGLLISNPGPYQSPTELQGLVVKPLDTCACNEILTAKWDIDNNVNNPNNYNLEQLIASRTGVSLADANYLICACDVKYTEGGGAYNPETSSWLTSANSYLQSTGITIPADLACSSGNGCTDCETVSGLMTALNTRFEDVTNFENTANYPIILTNYLNSELHFTLSYNDYIEFIGKCGATTENPYCTVNPLTYEWLDVMKLIAFRGMLLRPSTNPVDLMTDNIVFANGTWRDELNGNDYWSSVSGNVLTAYFGNNSGSNCQFQLTLPESAPFGFDDIVSFGQLNPLTTGCSPANNSFTVTVSYYSCGSLTTATLTGTSDCFEINECVCSPTGLSLCDEIPELESICYQPRLDELYQNALTAYDDNIEELYDDYIANYKSACAAAFDTEKFKYTGPQNLYQFTLFFYDQAGNLVKTVAPEGIPATFNQANVNAARNSVTSYTSFTPVSSFAPISPFPSNSFETVYTYNSYSQLVATVNPDQIDSTKFWYDFYGRMVASQNPVQADDKKYSYVLYDAQGRPVEVGQIDRDVPPNGGGAGYTLGVLSEFTHLKVDDLGAAFKSWVYNGTRTEVTYTVYDQPMDPAIEAKFATGTQQNLRLRVASVVYFDAVSASTMPVTGYVSASHYSYDLHGNVIEALQDVPALVPVQQDVKSTQYTFALLSGNVKKVEYQKGKRDRMTHEYLYDKLYRLAEVLTSTDDGVHKSREAHYRYFDYGPLSRVEIGQHKVQGNDFTYTINGWLKGMNSTTLDRTRDAGKDGSTGYLAANSRVNESVARDVTGYMMGYFSGDYKSINTGTTFEASIGSGNNLTNAIKQLYNGNIAYTTTGIDGFEIQAGVYAYDQLQRLKQMRVFRSTTLNSLNNWSGAVETQEYSSSYTYDRNGNLKTLNRKGTTAGGINMDDFAYKYVLGANRLTYVTDGAGTSSYSDDIEPGQSGTTNVPITGVHTSDNYQYYKLGQLTADVQEGQTMVWRVGDKKLKLQKNSSKQLEFVYNPFGQRV
ncbi:MAG: hypothetical protein HYZ43_11870, partial [Flavobacteriia bacterium]|nr:hypothetical protein [Flavobacteriia bacterium]